MRPITQSVTKLRIPLTMRSLIQSICMACIGLVIALQLSHSLAASTASLTAASSAAPKSLAYPRLAAQLNSKQYVLLMRHAYAPGVGDPAGYSLSNCQSQRNLNAEGRAQAKRIGLWLREQGVSAAQVHASQWCRCTETAKLLGFGYQVEPALASVYDHPEHATARTQSLQQFIAHNVSEKPSGALILVTHHVNIHAYMGENIGSGDMVLVRVDHAGKMQSYQVIPSP